MINIAHYPEKRLIVEVWDNHIIVIAESGWYNRYKIPPEFPITFYLNSGLVYTYKDRETLYIDFKKGVFDSYFNTN